MAHNFFSLIIYQLTINLSFFDFLKRRSVLMNVVNNLADGFVFLEDVFKPR
jgi:hypothetical protein